MGALLLLAMAWSPVPVGAAGRSVYVLDRQGGVFVWEEGEGGLNRVELPWSPVDELATLANGRHLLILTRDPAPHRRRRQESLAVVLEGSGKELRPSREISFEGRGLRAAVTDDGHRAYLLAYTPPPDGAASEIGRTWVHEVDLDTASVVSSTIMTEPALSIAVARGGRRIFVGVQGRILTYQTSPLTPSWYLRSPGPNLGLYRPRDTALLYAVRGHEVALFDPSLIESRTEAERRMLADDATSVLVLADQAADLLFAPGDSVAAAYAGTTRISFLDPRSSVTATASLAGFEAEGRLIRPLIFAEDGRAIAVAVFPDAVVRSLDVPAALSQPAGTKPPLVATGTPAAPIEVASVTSNPAPAAGSAPAPASTPTAELPPSLAPAAVIPPHRVIAGEVLRGILTGDRDKVAAIVIYGPDSLIREQARVLPGPDGAWEIPLPPPGTYRIVPVGQGSRSLHSVPNFQTVTVKPGEGIAGIDFRVRAL